MFVNVIVLGLVLPTPTGRAYLLEQLPVMV
jgi:hypothetical protein